MFSLVNRTLIRGRSLLPEIFLRIRKRRSCECFSFVLAMFFGATVFAVVKVIIELSCLPCARPSRRRNAHLCLCKAQVDNSFGSPQPLVQSLACLALRSSA